ncbi:hypothetical protein Aab01nite_20170 [Paractinoplanes abujensis]|uniref:Uncharacterized protein n=1 Tax=Paractinoplanes abujensis TaxID=882441 RepID=A0A7W7CZ49_9ACTN|nr:hypothetical protein [Actinoplanes abujensis]MBB4697099.1 hypothetical protein [Actinoplanes abujensis]GID18427.1 hypothetical protein Aab01nite_20170 [Actinoplanes abujensis]
MFPLLEALVPTASWAAVLFVGSFVVFVGATLTVTLLHRDREVRRHAARVLRQLLSFLRSR